MYLGKNLEAYSQLMKDNIFYYAYENHLPKPVLNEANPSWVGEVFEVANIDTELHLDLIEDLKAIGIYDLIKRDCDKFVILPDVFSLYPIPHRKYTDLAVPRNQYDTDRKNIVIINGKLFELNRELADAEYYYNHNGKFYYFYKNDTNMMKLFDPANIGNNTIKSITIKTTGALSDKVNYRIWSYVSDPESGFALYLDKDNKWIKDTDALANRKDAACVYINLPYVSLDYDTINSRPEADIPGLINISPDFGLRPKWFNYDFDRFFLQNPDVIYSSSAIVLMRDGTYVVENLYLNSKGKYVERIDKHTVKFVKDPNIKEVIMFAMPYKKPSFVVPDTAYYKAIKKNPLVAEFTSKYKCNTSKLYDLMIKKPCIEVEELIEYGYKYDVDVLKVIQNTFPRLTSISKYDIQIHQYYGHTSGESESFIYEYNRIWYRNIEEQAKNNIFSNPTLWNIFTERLKTYSMNEVIYQMQNIFDYTKHLLRKKDKINFIHSLTNFRQLLENIIALMKSYTDRINIFRDFPEYPAVIDFFIDLNKKPDEYYYVMTKTKRKASIIYPYHTFHLPKILITIWNPLQKYPALFINHILYPFDYKIIRDHDIDILVIDPKNFYEFYVDKDLSIFYKTDSNTNNSAGIDNYIERELEYNPNNTTSIANEKNIDFLYNIWLKNVSDLKIYLADNTEMKDPNDNKHIHGRIVRDPLNDFSIVDEFSSSKVNKTLYKGEPFVNGLLSNDIFNKKDTEIPLNLTTPVSMYGYGPNNMKNKKIITDNNDIFRDLDTCLAVTNAKFKYPSGEYKKFFGLSRINLGVKYNIFADYTIVAATGYKLHPLDTELFRDNQIICFNQYGLEVSEDVDILSKNYIDLNDITYDYDKSKMNIQTENQCISLFIPSYKSIEFDYDLEIDKSRISNGNTHYNDRILDVNEVVELFDPIPNKGKSWRPYDLEDDETIYTKSLAMRYAYNERSVGARDISSITETNGYDFISYMRSNAFKGYNPLDMLISGQRLKEMLETSKITFIIDNTTPQLWDHKSTPPTTLNNWRIQSQNAVFINCNAKYSYPDDPNDIEVPVTNFKKVPKNTLVVKYNTDIMRRFK